MSSSSSEALAKELISSMVILAEKLGQKSLSVDSSIARSREGDGGQFMQKFTAVQALAAPGKEEALENIRQKFEKILNKQSSGPEVRDALLEGIEKLRKVLLRSASGTSVGLRPKALGPSTSGTKLSIDSLSPVQSQSPSKLLSPIQQRGRSTSLHIPKSMMKPEKVVDAASPSGSPRGLTSSTLLSPRNSVGFVSPRGVRQVSFPVSLRWSVLHSIRATGMAAADVEAAICSFFDGVNDLVSEGVIVPSVTSKSSKPFQKSPRTNKLPSKKQESCMASLFGPLEPVLRVNSWMEVFQARLGITQTLVSGQLLDGLTELCNLILSKGATEAITESVAKRTTSLKRFLDTFVTDVDSAVIGLEIEG